MAAAARSEDRSRSPRKKVTPPAPANFYSREFLLSHIEDILRFYTPRAVDETGGYHQSYFDDGATFDTDFKQLVSSTRMVINFALAGKLLGREDLLKLARHGLDYVEKVHWQPDKEVYAFTLRNHKPEDMTQHSYAYSFLLAMHAASVSAGLEGPEPIARVFDLMEKRFWLPNHGTYADTISPEGVLDDYRGQNSNMHICEGLIAAYEATEDRRYLERAIVLAESFVQRLAKLGGGLVWEHFTKDYQIDWDYNKDDPKNLYRPWGFQPGHQVEWAKNLVKIHRSAPQDWMLERAKELYDRSYTTAWDREHGGLAYGFDATGKWCDDDKYFWTQAESIAGAAMLYQATQDEKYLENYRALWAYCWEHFVDHEHHGWWRVLSRNNVKYSNKKSAAGAKCDYHTMVSCMEALKHMK